MQKLRSCGAGPPGMQAQLSRLSTSAKAWGAQTGATLASVASGHLGSASALQHANSLAATRAAPSSGAAARSAEGASPSGGSAAAREPRPAEAGLGRDQELEAYLRVQCLIHINFA